MLNSVAAWSYGSAASAFLGLNLVLALRWRGRGYGRALALASLCSAAWAGCAALAPATLPQEVLELARDAGWTYLLMLLIAPIGATGVAMPRGAGSGISPRRAAWALYGGMLVAALAEYSMAAGKDQQFVAGLLQAAHVVAAVVGMLLVEQLFRHAAHAQRWGIKFACLGIGAMFSYDFYLYSNALLFRQMNPEIWAARGFANALTVPLVAISVMRNTAWSLRLALSRRLLFHSAAVSGSALYLLTMAAAGYYLRYFGGSWGAILQTALLFAAVVLLLVVIASGSFRAWLKVFIGKHFYLSTYDYREEWRRFTATLSDTGPAQEEHAVGAVAALVESPAGVLFVQDEQQHYTASAHWHIGPAAAREPADSAFCRLLREHHWVIDLSTAHGGAQPLPAPPAWLARIPDAWLVVPLILQAQLFGFIVLCAPRSKIKLNWEVLDLLKIAGSQVAGNLAHQRSAQALLVARQFESYNRMATFVVHDLKNLVSQLSLLVSNAERHHASPDFQKDMLETVEHSVTRMKHLLQKFKRSAGTERPVAVAIDTAVRQAIADKASGLPAPQLEQLDHDLVVLANPGRLQRVIGHLIQNAIEATPRDGWIGLKLLRVDCHAVLELRDSGSGMDAQFIRERLFKPFESTKAAGMGIGVFESREYIQELGGSLDVTSAPALGTLFRLTLPLHPGAAGRDHPTDNHHGT